MEEEKVEAEQFSRRVRRVRNPVVLYAGPINTTIAVGALYEGNPNTNGYLSNDEGHRQLDFPALKKLIRSLQHIPLVNRSKVEIKVCGAGLENYSGENMDEDSRRETFAARERALDLLDNAGFLPRRENIYWGRGNTLLELHVDLLKRNIHIGDFGSDFSDSYQDVI